MVHHKSIQTFTVNSNLLPCQCDLELGCSIRVPLSVQIYHNQRDGTGEGEYIGAGLPRDKPTTSNLSLFHPVFIGTEIFNSRNSILTLGE